MSGLLFILFSCLLSCSFASSLDHTYAEVNSPEELIKAMYACSTINTAKYKITLTEEARRIHSGVFKMTNNLYLNCTTSQQTGPSHIIVDGNGILFDFKDLSTTQHDSSSCFYFGAPEKTLVRFYNAGITNCRERKAMSISIDRGDFEDISISYSSFGLDVLSGNATFRKLEVKHTEIGIKTRGKANVHLKHTKINNNEKGIVATDMSIISIGYPASSIHSHSSFDVVCDGVNSSVLLVNRSSSESLCSGFQNLEKVPEVQKSKVTATRNTNYTFYISAFAGNPDGYPRAVLGVFPDGNNLTLLDTPFPGPMIRAKIGDTISVTVINLLDDEKTTIHFHGIHQVFNNWMDGTDGITECGINPGGKFTYVWTATQTGTYWYHSHSGAQYVDGVLGPIILDHVDLSEDPIFNEYPYTQEHVLVVQDWFHETSTDLEVLYKGPFDLRYPPFIAQYPWTHDAILINGRGAFDCVFNDKCHLEIGTNQTGQCLRERGPLFGNCTANPYPPQKYACEYGSFARFRFINSGNNLPLVIWIDEHNVTVVAKDGIEIVPYQTPFITIPVGQRLDVIVECDQDPDYDYNITVRIPRNFIPENANVVNLTAVAVLSYDMKALPQFPSVAVFDYDTINTMCYQTFEFGLQPLQDEPLIALPADERINLYYDAVYTKESGWPLEEWCVNNITFMNPTMNFLQADALGIDVHDTLVSNHIVHNGTYGPMDYYRATNMIDLEYGKTYEFILWSNEGQQHPWHIHGYSVNFTDSQMNVLPGSKLYDDSYTKPVPIISRGDSFTVPSTGYTTFRMTADNPGAWLMHCHVDWHMKLGMVVVINVQPPNGTYRGLLPPPPDSVHMCIDWQTFRAGAAAITKQDKKEKIEDSEISHHSPSPSSSSSSFSFSPSSLLLVATFFIVFVPFITYFAARKIFDKILPYN